MVAAMIALGTAGYAQAEEQKYKYFLMIAEPDSATWKGVITGGGDMMVPARAAIEAMGGQLLSYYIGVGEAKNYGVVAFPDSYDIAKITYLRAAQGVMKSLQFIEVIPSDAAVAVLDDVKEIIETD
jgi:hypothetical protein